ncbi:MAG: hypothetical protein GX851_04215 [Clostridiales bacterium]|nr:hypothetical protein [Clostridiales bacterium]
MLNTVNKKLLLTVKTVFITLYVLCGAYASLGIFKYSVSFEFRPLAKIPGLENNAGSMIFPIIAWIFTLALVLLLVILGWGHISKALSAVSGAYVALGYPLRRREPNPIRF